MLILFSLTTISACKTGDFVKIKPKQKIDWTGFSPECQKFVEDVVRLKWKVHKSGDCYFHDKEFYHQLQMNNECFLGISFEQIEIIFGVPNKQEPHFRKYYIGAECNPLVDYLTLSFVGFPEDKKVTQVVFDQIRSN